MKLEFKARSVNYDEAIGGDIVQAIFEENPDDDPLEPTSKSLSLSINYEFPPCNLNVEWCDGSEYGGGAEIKSYQLNERELSLFIENDSTIVVAFSTTEEIYKNIEKLLINELGQPVNA